MEGPVTQPVEIELDRTKEVRIRWAAGEASVYPPALLRGGWLCAAGDAVKPTRAER